MAKQDKETYDSYEKDVYDNPPAGPMGVHRGARSAASRAMPYVIVIIVALLAGLLFWSIYSGEINNLKMPWSSQEHPMPIRRPTRSKMIRTPARMPARMPSRRITPLRSRL